MGLVELLLIVLVIAAVAGVGPRSIAVVGRCGRCYSPSQMSLQNSLLSLLLLPPRGE